MERESFSSSKADSLDFDNELTLSEKLKVFKSSNFDPKSYVTSHCGAMSEKAIRHLCIYLVGLKKGSAEEMRKNVYANYASFIRTSREISDLEGELVSLKNLLSSRANIIHTIADGVRIESLHEGPHHHHSPDDPLEPPSNPITTDLSSNLLVETLEILLAEHRVDEALSLLDDAERAALDKPLAPSSLLSLQNTILEYRQRLADQLAESTCQASTTGPELRMTIYHHNPQELCEDIGSLDIMQLSEHALEGVLQSFGSYVSTMINAFSASFEIENLEGSGRKIVKLAETETQQIALLANALSLADELLPRAAIKLSSFARNDEKGLKQRELKRRLQRLVEQLRDSFCRQHALDISYSLKMVGGEPEWFPSPVFQELFVKLTRIASIASDIFVGRERFATILLMRLTETVILWFSEDQNFWDELETGERTLGPLGLQQFYLDMEFVILFASQGRYLSRNLHQVMKNIIGRAIEAVQAKNIDPYSVLPEDEWFADVAQIAIKMLMGHADFENAERDMNSPTTSMSARSVSSAHSHGSS
ncbi:exocyst complex component EXO84A [Striga asiatica]|uniref:Exocyst complex component EXO84A n=1 Tax=Striga asiatica TaxID=4170 RepID=A0A5A7Q7L2_STRAF|nr:exocyst complex component EXO84A [Striga asiatica]